MVNLSIQSPLQFFGSKLEREVGLYKFTTLFSPQTRVPYGQHILISYSEPGTLLGILYNPQALVIFAATISVDQVSKVSNSNEATKYQS